MAQIPHDIEEFDRELPVVLAETVRGKWAVRGRKALKIVTRFALGQGAVQSLNILINLFLIRALSIDSYAQFGLALGFQSVFSVLMDLGFASTIVPLVGDRRHDREVLGRYVRSAKHLRDKSFWILSPIAAVAFLAVMQKHHWDVSTKLLLLVAVLISLYSSGKLSYFSAPLFVFGRLKEYYVPQVLSGAGRFICYFFLAITKGLNAWTAAGLNALNIVVNAQLIKKASEKHFDWPVSDDPQTDKELLHYILPASPAIIFSAFQSQISLFLISIFGGTLPIAEVTALSRLAQIFSVVLTFYTIVIEPYIARQSRVGLVRTFIKFILIAMVAFTPIVVVAYLWPEVFIFVLGPKYQGLYGVIGLYILSCAMNAVSNLLWIMNRSRKWVFWSGSLLEVVLLLAVQTIFLIFVGIRTTREAVLLSFVSSFCYVIAHGYVAVYGFLRDRG